MLNENGFSPGFLGKSLSHRRTGSGSECDGGFLATGEGQDGGW